VRELTYMPGWMRKTAEERWLVEREAEVRRIEEELVREAREEAARLVKHKSYFHQEAIAKQRQVLLDRENYHRKRLAQRPEPSPRRGITQYWRPTHALVVRLANERLDAERFELKRDVPVEHNNGHLFRNGIMFVAVKPTFTIDKRIIEDVQRWNNPAPDARDRQWNGYVWECV
tara:strand:- start:708 stop:1229 length:522 start_codon:yes stop_codon:yes gene_type:complete